MSQSSGPQIVRGDKSGREGGRRTGISTLARQAGLAGMLLLLGTVWSGWSRIEAAGARDLLVASAVAVGFALVVASVVTARVVIPRLQRQLAEAADDLEAAALGDFTRIAPSASGDDLDGRLAAARTRAFSSIRSLVDANRDSARDVAARASAMVHLGTSGIGPAQRLVDATTLAQASGSAIGENARRVQVAADEVAARVAALAAERPETQARERLLHEVAAGGMAHLEAGTAALAELSESSRSGVEESAALAQATAEIQSFVALVNKMARQSKLLALNAAMEAARAGEHGSGFSVVAGEVRRLAKSSTEAAERTAALVQDVMERAQLIHEASMRSVEAAGLAQDATARSLEDLEALRSAMSGGTSGDDGSTRMRASLEALLARVQDLSREAEELAAAQRDCTAIAATQQSRIQEISAAASSLSRVASNSLAQLARIRTGADVAATSTPSVPDAAPNEPPERKAAVRTAAA